MQSRPARNTNPDYLVAITLCAICYALSLVGCGAAESVYHDGNFTEEQKKAAQQEYQSVEDEESQGSNKKKKSVKR